MWNKNSHSPYVSNLLAQLECVLLEASMNMILRRAALLLLKPFTPYIGVLTLAGITLQASRLTWNPIYYYGPTSNRPIPHPPQEAFSHIQWI